jgi:hypothetical protein
MNNTNEQSCCTGQPVRWTVYNSLSELEHTLEYLESNANALLDEIGPIIRRPLPDNDFKKSPELPDPPDIEGGISPLGVRINAIERQAHIIATKLEIAHTLIDL